MKKLQLLWSKITVINVWVVVLSCLTVTVSYRGGCRGRVQGARTAPSPSLDLWLSNTVIKKTAVLFDMYSQQFTLCYCLIKSLLSSYSLLKFVFVTSQLRHSLVVQILPRKILDPPLSYRKEYIFHTFSRSIDCIALSKPLTTPSMFLVTWGEFV